MSVSKLAALVAAVCVALLVAPGMAAAQTPSTGTAVTNLQHIAVTGEARNGKAFSGQFRGDRVVTRGGKSWAVGRLAGKVGKRSIKRSNVAIPVSVGSQAPASGAATCPILHLVLGPLDLNLLGLRIQLNQVVLDITAQSGPGNLLGNLLCAIAGLLDNNGLLSNLLNGLLGVFGLTPTAVQNPFLNIPVTGTFPSTAAARAAPNATGTFAGVLNIARFAVKNGKLQALGTLKGTMVDSAGKNLG